MTNEDGKCIMTQEFIHIKETMKELKDDIKEQTKEMLNMRDSKIRTEMSLEAIVTSTAKQSLELTKVLGKLQEIKDEKPNQWRKMSLAWKITLGSTMITFIVMSVGTMIKIAIDYMSKH